MTLQSLSLPTGMRTPGAMSVSSLRVETGSVNSSEGGPNPAEVDVQASLAANDVADSPLSSPILAGIAIPDAPDSSVDGTIPPLKNPLDSLRVGSSRPGSIRSISSLSVEAASEDVADLSEMSTVGSTDGNASTPTIEIPGPELSEIGTVSGDRARLIDGAEREQARRAQMSAELAEYESDERDPAALGPYQGESHSGGDAGEAKEPPFADDEDELERPETPKPGVPSPPSPEPGVKCSDCGEEVELVDLANHSCKRTNPSLSPTVPDVEDLPNPSTRAPMPVAELDVPEDPLEDDASGRSKKRSSEPVVERLDAFVPQTNDLVPEDIVDAYGEDPVNEVVGRATASTGHPPSLTQDVPDVPSDDVENPLNYEGSAIGRHADVPSEPMTRSSSTPGPAVSRIRKASNKPRVQSAYGGPMPGRYYTDDEEEGEPGSATIVRSPSWHTRQ